MALERADIGVLCGGARAHRALAQIDFLESRARGRRVVVEQRALRDRLADGAFDVALAQIVAALELLVEPFQHAARLLAGAARALDGDVIAALFGDDAEPAFDQREVLSVLSEQHRGEPVVLEREHGLRGGRFLGGGGGRDHGIRCAQGGFKLLLWRSAARGCSASANAPKRLLVPISVIVTRTDEPISVRRRHHLDRLQIWGAADDCPASLPGFSSSTSMVRPAKPALKSRRWRVMTACSRCRRSDFLVLGHLIVHLGRRRARARRIHERIGAGEADLVDERQRVAEIGFGLAGKADDEIGGEREIGAARRAGAQSRQDSRDAYACGSSPPRMRSEPDCTGRCT